MMSVSLKAFYRSTPRCSRALGVCFVQSKKRQRERETERKVRQVVSEYLENEEGMALGTETSILYLAKDSGGRALDPRVLECDGESRLPPAKGDVNFSSTTLDIRLKF